VHLVIDLAVPDVEYRHASLLGVVVPAFRPQTRE